MILKHAYNLRHSTVNFKKAQCNSNTSKVILKLWAHIILNYLHTIIFCFSVITSVSRSASSVCNFVLSDVLATFTRVSLSISLETFTFSKTFKKKYKKICLPNNNNYILYFKRHYFIKNNL